MRTHRAPSRRRSPPPAPPRDEKLLDYVRRRLGECRRGGPGEGWPAIVVGSGVRYDTISRIYRGAIKDPCVSKVQALIDYFDRA